MSATSLEVCTGGENEWEKKEEEAKEGRNTEARKRERKEDESQRVVRVEEKDVKSNGKEEEEWGTE